MINTNIKIDENFNLTIGSQNTDLSVSSFLYLLQNKFPKDESPSQYHYLLLKELAIPEHLISNPEFNSYKTKKINSFLEDEEIEAKIRPKKRRSDKNSSGGVKTSEESVGGVMREVGFRSNKMSVKSKRNLLEKHWKYEPAAYSSQKNGETNENETSSC